MATRGGTRQAGDTELEVRVLGPLEASRGRRTIPIGGHKPRALFASLALEPRHVVSVDRLVENLWPTRQPETAAHAVQVYVSQLRKALGTGTIATRAPGYVLDIDEKHVDVHRFERLVDEGRAALQAGDAFAADSALREALGLWRGSALADFTYDPFAQTEIARLEELRRVALEERVEAELLLGRHGELVSELEALVDAEPLRERPRAQLMLALYRSGRQADALAAYRAARQTLVDELGIEPGPALKELEASILRQDDSLLLEEGVEARPAMQFRRLVTILFVDIVGSMALAEKLDPEALGRVLQRYFEMVSAALRRHGGVVEKYAGDAVLAAFGIPVSHEDDALRAARAAIDVRMGLAELNERLGHEHGIGLEVRIGVETGEAVTTTTEARQRLVTGEVVGVASRLEQRAAPGEIVVGELAARLIDHAATLEPLGELRIRGKREPLLAFRLLDIAPVASAFERRLDAPLVGRGRELAALRKAFKGATDTGSVRVVVVIGPPGVGKSRLAAEVARRVKGATRLYGRCLSYGDGITYWPLREILDTAGPSEERDAVVAALDADSPSPASEIASLFRRFCEGVASELPLILVLDDVHWAEPTLLKLVEHLADRGEGPILVICVAREELLEEHPSFLSGRANIRRIALDSLSTDQADALLEGLGAAVLETDQRSRIAETAEGNPFFVEQLLALALEGGPAAHVLPETVQALLAARLDRLGPGERAVLERGAVVGKEFTRDDVFALLEPHAAKTAEPHLRTLAARGFVRPRDENAYAFRHGLVQEAVYRAAPKRLRADLHERFADRLDSSAAEEAVLDEFVGYHLERASRLLMELGESDRRAARLAQDGGRRLGAAGVRALKRGDIHATTSLLGRATSLLPRTESHRRELLSELGIALRTSGDYGQAQKVLAGAIRDSEEAADRAGEWRARMEHEYVRLQREPGTTADALLEAAYEGIPVFESAGSERSLGRAWLLAGFVQGGHLGRYKAGEQAAERALVHYRNAGWPTSTCLGEIAAALLYGPTAVPDAIHRCEQLRVTDVSDRIGEANVIVFLGGLAAQQGHFAQARELIGWARDAYEELGHRAQAWNYCATVLGDVELLAGQYAVAEAVLRSLCEELERTHDYSHLASRASGLAEAVLQQGRVDEAEEWTKVAETYAAPDDLDAQMMWRPVRARIHARRDNYEKAEVLALDAIRLSTASDALNRCAKAHRDLGEVLSLCGRQAEAAESVHRAASIYKQKGNLVGAAEMRTLSTDLALV
ncbi:MAG TPA: BTAD domain-containing putative transcriptional regulator [Gaiellaceae bacterium]|nr:BTAD domain-containing putative transcriptional regulator [Gaiellaceae bacterium]